MVRGSRAQLILIGALVVALSVIGVTVVINTVLFVENTPTDRQTARIDRAATVDDDARRAVRSTALRVNHRSRNHSASQVSDAVGRNVSALNDLFQQQYLSSQSLSVAVTYEGAATEGFRVVQAADGPLTSDAGSPDWSPVPAGSGRVGWLVVNLNATATATGRFYANVSNSAGETLSVALNKTSDRTVNVTSSPPGGGSTRVTCDVRNGRLALDLQRGRSVAATGCRFDGAEQLGSPTSVTFGGRPGRLRRDPAGLGAVSGTRRLGGERERLGHQRRVRVPQPEQRLGVHGGGLT
jgi:hypothetical protein